MISTSSRKAKGRRLQNKVRDLILEKFDLHPVKVKSSFVWFNIFIGFTCSEFVRKLNGTISKIKLNRPILLNSSSFKLQILQLLLSLLWNFSWFKKPNDPLLTSRWSLLKCLSFKKKFASEKGILSELDPKQDSGFSLNLQISDFK